jgi:hypothetical protein
VTSEKFKQLERVDDIAGVIKDIFELELDVKGGWGYDNKTALEVGDLKNMSLDQFLHMFGMVRATIEMNLTLQEDERYGGIAVDFVESKKFEIDSKTYDIVTLKITAMPEKLYANFIQEYKEGYGKNDFDMQGHFDRRKEATIDRIVDFWFLGLKGV